jgi:hypothetical protein
MTSIRRMGDGYEPHVDDVSGRLVYSLPVDSSIVTSGFSFDITPDDLTVLLDDSYRRAMLAVIAHTVLQRSMIRGNPPVGQGEFDRLVSSVLRSSDDDLEAFADRIDREHNIRVRIYVDQELTRRRAQGILSEETAPSRTRPHLSTGNNHGARRHRKRPLVRQHDLKPTAGPARARIVAPEFFDEFDVAVDEAQAALHACFGRIALTPFRADLESRAGRRVGRCDA